MDLVGARLRPGVLASAIFWQAWQGFPWGPPVSLKFATDDSAPYRIKLAIRDMTVGPESTSTSPDIEIWSDSMIEPGRWYSFLVYPNLLRRLAVCSDIAMAAPRGTTPAMDPMARLSVRLHVTRDRLGDGALSHHEHVVADVMSVQAEVMNGGFHQFFFNKAGDRATKSVSALREIGAAATAAIVAKACSRFPNGAPEANRVARQRQLETLRLEAFRDLDKRFVKHRDQVAALLAGYWNKHGRSDA